MTDLPLSSRSESHDCGHCGACKWWQTDPDAHAFDESAGLCLHEELVHFNLQVSAASGCNRFRQAQVPVAAGR
jgi:hypothetical protein